MTVGLEVFQPRPCGTHAGYLRHRKEGTPTCDACREALNAYMRKWRKRNGEAQRRDRARSAAQSRALWRLAAIHGSEFEALVAEELAK